MKNLKLLPHSLKIWGWIMLIIGVILWVIQLICSECIQFKITTFTITSDQVILQGKTNNLNFNKVEFAFTLISLLIIIGGLIVAFSKSKIEDEYTQNLRLISLQKALLWNYILLILALLLIYGLSFLQVLMYNMFTTLLLFIIVFEYSMYQTRLNFEDEE